jgi:hypothetical protein
MMSCQVQILRRGEDPAAPSVDEASGAQADVSAPANMSDRLKTIRMRLNYLGANAEFCDKYFESSSGSCEEFRCQVCVKHSFGVSPLPAGLMCRNAFEKYLGQLRGKISLFNGDITAHRQMWNQLRAEEIASGFLSGGDSSSGDAVASHGPNTKVSCHSYFLVRIAKWRLRPVVYQALLKERRNELEDVIRHKHGMIQRLKGERRALLIKIRPVDTVAWHREVCALLEEEMDLLERRKIGRLADPVLPPGHM